MDFDETMENGTDNDILDEVLEDDVAEETEEPEESLDSLMDEGKPAESEQSPKDPQGTNGEPGWFKARWAKEVGKLTDQIRNELRNEYEAQIAPMRERMLEMDARELVKSGVVKDLETAKELVRYRQGQTGQPSQQETNQGGSQPRQANGQFAPKSDSVDPAIQARIDMLQHQADRIKAEGGPDVIAAWRSNKKYYEAVVAGTMDFYDIAREETAVKKKPPAPMRSPNGVNGQIKGTIMSMSDKQFEMLEKKVREGGVRFRE